MRKKKKWERGCGREKEVVCRVGRFVGVGCLGL